MTGKTVKKILPLLLALVLALPLLSSCGEKGGNAPASRTGVPAGESAPPSGLEDSAPSGLPGGTTAEVPGETEDVPPPSGEEKKRPDPEPVVAPVGQPVVVVLSVGAPDVTELTSVDLRAAAVAYMQKMANVVWTAGQKMDFSEIAPGLIFEEGSTYLGLPYNGNRSGRPEEFYAALENGVYSKSRTPANTPGNTCSTSILTAWQVVGPRVDYAYTIDMMPFVRENGVVPVGDVPWENYDGAAGAAGDTRASVLLALPEARIYEAYALSKPGDAFMRQIGNSGHAMMVTGETVTARDKNGAIDPLNSYVILTEQNTLIRFDREYPSTWGYDFKALFSDLYREGYLPVTTPELRDNKTETPVFYMDAAPDLSGIEKGEMIAALESNFCVYEVNVELFGVGPRTGLIASRVVYPHARRVPLAGQIAKLGVADLPAGSYILRVTASTPLAEGEALRVAFTKGE